jgi:hypothetical protein
VITTFHGPADVVLGMANVAVSRVAEPHETLDALIVVEPECCSIAVAPDMKFPPVMVVVTESPAYPSSGSIPLKEGAAAAVVVAAVATVVVFVVTTVVGTGVGAAVGIDETVTWVIFTLYTFSIVKRGYVSVFEFIRYPHVPSVFL